MVVNDISSSGSQSQSDRQLISFRHVKYREFVVLRLLLESRYNQHDIA